MLDGANSAALESTGTVFCLTAPAEEIIRRVLSDEGGPERPLLAGDDPEERVRTLMAERAPLYARFVAIETLGRQPDDIAEEILSKLGM